MSGISPSTFHSPVGGPRLPRSRSHQKESTQSSVVGCSPIEKPNGTAGEVSEMPRCVVLGASLRTFSATERQRRPEDSPPTNLRFGSSFSKKSSSLFYFFPPLHQKKRTRDPRKGQWTVA